MFNFFRKTIAVTFINDNTKEIIGKSEMKQEELPESFENSTSIQLEGIDWQVISAHPLTARDFSLSKKLTIYLQKIEYINPDKVRFTIATISNELPGLSSSTLNNDFTVKLKEDDWRQIELLPLSLLPTIQEEMQKIEEILFPEDEPEERFGFDKLHVREKIGTNHLIIPFDDFCESINVQAKGSLGFQGQSGYVENGFALRSSDYTYYGILKDGMITELCLEQYENSDTELISIFCAV
jgi:hypothetical protein